jgi:hypothetical protein
MPFKAPNPGLEIQLHFQEQADEIAVNVRNLEVGHILDKAGVGHTVNDSILKLSLDAEFAHSFAHTDLLKKLVDICFDKSCGGFRVEVGTPHRGHFLKSRGYSLAAVGGWRHEMNADPMVVVVMEKDEHG